MNLKKIEKLFTSKFVGTGPSSYKKRIYRAAVSQRLRNTVLVYHLKLGQDRYLLHFVFLYTITSFLLMLLLHESLMSFTYSFLYSHCFEQNRVSIVTYIISLTVQTLASGYQLTCFCVPTAFFYK